MYLCTPFGSSCLEKSTKNTENGQNTLAFPHQGISHGSTENSPFDVPLLHPSTCCGSGRKRGYDPLWRGKEKPSECASECLFHHSAANPFSWLASPVKLHFARRSSLFLLFTFFPEFPFLALGAWHGESEGDNPRRVGP